MFHLTIESPHILAQLKKRRITGIVVRESLDLKVKLEEFQDLAVPRILRGAGHQDLVGASDCGLRRRVAQDPVMDLDRVVSRETNGPSLIGPLDLARPLGRDGFGIQVVYTGDYLFDGRFDLIAISILYTGTNWSQHGIRSTLVIFPPRGAPSKGEAPLDRG